MLLPLCHEKVMSTKPNQTKKALIFNSDPINLACFLAKQARLSILHKAQAEQAVTVKNNGIGFGKRTE
jgi:hypothetical protein